ncbi:IclR family transcriptional regulator [Sneathiella chinensis]|uniref:Transcriptional regulator n=1 Tax=Sneathiella chinensis TaxID=349750 RepID=A0ABQ5U2G8_9PROT|nr:IclR family transcriptional regulator [Sneathiella chinensis]GLQ05601.1 transcriptional regulator [Sneathiella chinensis]
MKPEELTEETLEKDRHFVTSLARGLEVLRAFRPGEGPMGNNELSRRTGLPKSTISRLTSTLVQLGYLLHREEIGRYEPSPSVLALGYTVLANSRLRVCACPAMRELVKQGGFSVSLGARDKMTMLYLEAVRGAKTSTLVLDVGTHIPLATSAMGRAYLCRISDQERDDILDQVRVQAGSDWTRVRKGVEQAQRDYEDFGFCLSLGGWQRATSAVGVPVRDAGNGDVMAFNCGGSSYLLSEEKLREEIGPQLVGLARGVEVMCGQV